MQTPVCPSELFLGGAVKIRYSLPSFHKTVAALLFSAALFLHSCSSGDAGGFYRLTIAHLNDTHSQMEPLPVVMTIGGLKTVVRAGGFARLQTLVNEMRATSKNFLLLHAGDAVQGTLYFTLFNGQVEFDFLNRLGVDAMTFGNHEFDRGTAAIPSYLHRATFPILSANIDFSGEPAIAPLVPTRIVREVNGERIAIIGLTTETTPQSTMDVGKAKFLDPQNCARREVAALEDVGINKIIVLSHLGYAEDLKLAAAVSGIDIIVGGHSHSLLGEPLRLFPLGMTPAGNYPTEVRSPDGGRSLVLQAWQWGDLLGRLDLDFDHFGKITSYRSAAVIPVADSFTRNGVAVPFASQSYLEIIQTFNLTGTVRIASEDPATAAALTPYSAQLVNFRKTVVATAAEDLIPGVNSGPGPLAADSMLAAVPKARVAILNFGGVRRGLPAGPISVGDLLEVMPFANTLVLVDLTGAELKNALEEDIDFLITKYGQSLLVPPYVSGVSFTLSPGAAVGGRVSALAAKDAAGLYRPVDPLKVYRTVVNSFVAGGGDGFTSIKNAKGFRTDTGIIDSDALRDYLKKLGRVHNRAEKRVTVRTQPTQSLSQLISYAGDSCHLRPLFSFETIFQLNEIREIRENQYRVTDDKYRWEVGQN